MKKLGRLMMVLGVCLAVGGVAYAGTAVQKNGEHMLATHLQQGGGDEVPTENGTWSWHSDIVGWFMQFLISNR